MLDGVQQVGWLSGRGKWVASREGKGAAGADRMLGGCLSGRVRRPRGRQEMRAGPGSWIMNLARRPHRLGLSAQSSGCGTGGLYLWVCCGVCSNAHRMVAGTVGTPAAARQAAVRGVRRRWAVAASRHSRQPQQRLPWERPRLPAHHASWRSLDAHAATGSSEHKAPCARHRLAHTWPPALPLSFSISGGPGRR